MVHTVTHSVCIVYRTTRGCLTFAGNVRLNVGGAYGVTRRMILYRPTRVCLTFAGRIETMRTRHTDVGLVEKRQSPTIARRMPMQAYVRCAGKRVFVSTTRRRLRQLRERTRTHFAWLPAHRRQQSKHRMQRAMTAHPAQPLGNNCGYRTVVLPTT